MLKSPSRFVLHTLLYQLMPIRNNGSNLDRNWGMFMSLPLTQVTIEAIKPKNKNDSMVQISNHLFTSLGLNKNNLQLNIKLGKKQYKQWFNQ